MEWQGQSARLAGFVAGLLWAAREEELLAAGGELPAEGEQWGVPVVQFLDFDRLTMRTCDFLGVCYICYLLTTLTYTPTHSHRPKHGADRGPQGPDRGDAVQRVASSVHPPLPAPAPHPRAPSLPPQIGGTRFTLEVHWTTPSGCMGPVLQWPCAQFDNTPHSRAHRPPFAIRSITMVTTRAQTSSDEHPTNPDAPPPPVQEVPVEAVPDEEATPEKTPEKPPPTASPSGGRPVASFSYDGMPARPRRRHVSCLPTPRCPPPLCPPFPAPQ